MMSWEGDKNPFAKCVRIFYGMGEETEDSWWLWYNQPELNKYFNNHFSPDPRFIDTLCSCKRIKMKTLESYKSSRHCWTQYDPQWPLTAKQPETIQNSVYILIYKECTPAFWKSDENSQTTIMRFSHSSNPETSENESAWPSSSRPATKCCHPVGRCRV